MKAILSVGARSLAAVAVRAAGVDLLGVNQGGVEQNADRLGSVEHLEDTWYDFGRSCGIGDRKAEPYAGGVST